MNSAKKIRDCHTGFKKKKRKTRSHYIFSKRDKLVVLDNKEKLKTKQK